MNTKMVQADIILVILFSISSAIILIISQNTTRETHVILFAIAIFLCSLTVFILSQKNFGQRLIRTLISASYWLVFYSLFINYKNYPWWLTSPPGPRICGGPCGGIYLYQFEPPYLFLACLAVIALLLGILIHKVMRW